MSKEEHDLKYTKNIKAFIQILPIEEKCWKYVKVGKDRKELYLRYVHDFAKGANVKEPNFWKFYTDGVLSDYRPNEINTIIVDDEALERACAGVSLLVFAYGQTGSGKSNTMNGLLNVYENRGLISRVIPRLFAMKRRLRNDYHVDFRVSYSEIHRRYVLDLLNERTRVHHTFCDLSSRRIRSEQEMLIALFAGEGQKRICKFRNYLSHYYTTVFTITVYSRTMRQSDTTNRLAKIHFIDMAGADTKGNPSCSWKTNEEIGTANLNKSQLEHCLLLLQENIDKETIIKDGGLFVDLIGKELKPESNIRFIGHIRPVREYLYNTRSTLKFATIARKTQTAKLIPIKRNNADMIIRKLDDSLTCAKTHNYITSMIVDKDLSDENLDLRLVETKQAIDKFLLDQTDLTTFTQITDPRVASMVFKEMVIQLGKTSTLRSLTTQPSMESKPNLENATPSTTHEDKPKRKKDAKQIDKLTRGSNESKVSKKKGLMEIKSSKTSLRTIRTASVRGSGLDTNANPITLEKLMAYTKRVQNRSRLAFRRRVSLQSISELGLKTSSMRSKVGFSSLGVSKLTVGGEFGEEFGMSYVNYTIENPKYLRSKEMMDKIEVDSKEVVRKYNTQIEKMNQMICNVQNRKNDLYKLRAYIRYATTRCCPTETIKLKKSEQKLVTQISDTMYHIKNKRETILTLQGEIEVYIHEYQRIRAVINEDFRLFCLEKYNITVPAPEEEILECLPDQLDSTKADKQEYATEYEQIEKMLFEQLQRELVQIQERGMMMNVFLKNIKK